MKIRLGAAALADPTCGQMILAFDGRRHGPSHRLRKLRREIPRDRKNIAGLGVIHDRQLPSLAHVAGVGQELAHEIEQRDAAHNLHTLIAVGREQHVARAQRHALRHRHRFLSRGANVKGNLAGALHALHAIVENARQQHVAQAHLQLARVKMRIPRTDCLAGIVEHPHQVDRQRHHVARARIDFRARHGARGRELHVTEVRGLAGAGRNAGQVQTRLFAHPHNLRLPAGRRGNH